MTSNTICLFDVDGTLTKPRLRITQDLYDFLQQLKTKVTVGFVGGSDIAKIAEQVEPEGTDKSPPKVAIAKLLQNFEYVFAENGLVAYKNGECLPTDNIVDFIGEDKLQRFINFALRHLSEITLPCKRGNFIEFRTGLINICPVGRSCSQAEREQFAEYDAKNNIRRNLVTALQREFGDELGLAYAIGGQISIDAFPKGWDKTYCLRFLSHFDKIHFFGDKTFPGGNDHEIFADSRTVGHSVTSPDHTKQILSELFF